MAGYIFIAPRVYYLKTNGVVVKKTMDGEGWFTKDISPEEDWDLYPELKEYNKEALDYIQLKYKEFETEFNECTSYHVDVASKKIVFEYGEKPNPPEVPQTPSLHERVGKLESNEKFQEDMIVDNAYRVALLELSAQGISL